MVLRCPAVVLFCPRLILSCDKTVLFRRRLVPSCGKTVLFCPRVVLSSCRTVLFCPKVALSHDRTILFFIRIVLHRRRTILFCPKMVLSRDKTSLRHRRTSLPRGKTPRNGGWEAEFDVSAARTGLQTPREERRPDGAQRAPGEVTNQQLADAVAGTGRNSNGVAPPGITIRDPPTQGEMQQAVDELDELITAQRR
ncbi:MAG TPA: hypothetical protein VI454_19120 [Verrucomicrobiae bacterium]|jgi:hypothetical protein